MPLKFLSVFVLGASGMCISALGVSTTTLLYSPNANAGIYKCEDGNGGITYSQMPCPATEKTADIITTKSSKSSNADCRLANSFAKKVAMDMRSGMTSGDMFAQYGGIDSIPTSAIGIINYVYTHRQNLNITTSRITALSAARCSADSYGPVACENFPFDFIDSQGGCDVAKKGGLKMENTPASASVAPQSLPVNPQATAIQKASTAEQKLACQKSVQDQMAALFEKMRTAQSASSQDGLTARKQELQDRLAGC
jgi:hypothetical protein